MRRRAICDLQRPDDRRKSIESDTGRRARKRWAGGWRLELRERERYPTLLERDESQGFVLCSLSCKDYDPDIEPCAGPVRSGSLCWKACDINGVLKASSISAPYPTRIVIRRLSRVVGRLRAADGAGELVV